MTSFELRKNDNSSLIIEQILELSNNHTDIDVYNNWYSIHTQLKGYICRDLDTDKLVLHLYGKKGGESLEVDLENIESIYIL